MAFEGGITELCLHTEGGSLVWDATVHRELAEIFHLLAMDQDTKVVLLTGSGASFCDSIDLQSFKDQPPGWENIWWEGQRLARGIVDLEVPVVAAINGPLTIHSEYPVMADIVIATPKTTFADRAHLVRGTVPGDGVHASWSLLLGPSRARYFLMTGATIAAEEAKAIGFVHEVVGSDDLLERARSVARDLARLPRHTLRYARATLSLPIRRHFTEDLSHGLALEGLGHYAAGGIRLPMKE